MGRGGIAIQLPPSPLLNNRGKMNLFLRLLICWIASKKRRHNLSDKLRQTFRMFPHDMSLRDHVPNFRYSSFAELGRFQFWQGLESKINVGVFNVVVAAQQFVYIYPVRLFSRMELDTRLISWDRKYFYFRHDYYVKDRLVATGLVKEAVVFSGKIIVPQEMTGQSAPENAESVVAAWRDLQVEIQNSSYNRP
jgi:acyl-CoA thioesterase FadM